MIRSGPDERDGGDGPGRRHGGRDRLVGVNELNEYLYCPRRCWYHRFYAEPGRTTEFVDGQQKHDRQAQRSGTYREQYFRDEDLGLHGFVDLIEEDGGVVTPVERKRSESGRVYWADEVQLAAYCMLVERTTDGRDINVGYVYLYSTDERHAVRITADHREAVRGVAESIRALSPDAIPGLVENRNKCDACSFSHVCQPDLMEDLNDIRRAPSGTERRGESHKGGDI